MDGHGLAVVAGCYSFSGGTLGFGQSPWHRRHGDAARYLCSIVHFPAESFANASDCRYCFDGSAALR